MQVRLIFLHRDNIISTPTYSYIFNLHKNQAVNLLNCGILWSIIEDPQILLHKLIELKLMPPNDNCSWDPIINASHQIYRYWKTTQLLNKTSYFVSKFTCLYTEYQTKPNMIKSVFKRRWFKSKCFSDQLSLNNTKVWPSCLFLD